MKMSPILCSYFVSILALFCTVAFLASHQPKFLFGGHQYDVRIVNGFSNNSSLALVIWCWTDRDKMGGRALQEGDDYSWSIEMKPLLYSWAQGVHNDDVFCTMKWDQKRKQFTAFQASKDTYRCSPLRLCFWLVKEDGFYFSNDGFSFRRDFAWA